MARDIARRWLLGSLAAGLVAGMSGCASYYSHYAMFPAENSRGEPRQVRVSWLTAEYPDWWLQDDEATAIRVETQCSERVWLLRQAGADGALSKHGKVGDLAAEVVRRFNLAWEMGVLG